MKTCLTLSMLALAAASQAAVTFEFNTVATGGTPAGGPVYATLTIEDVAANTVGFTFTNTTNPGAAGGQFISRLHLNVDPFVAGTLNWTSPTISSYEFDQDGINDAGARFDLSIRFVTANSGDRFTAGKTVTWTATGTGLTENSFDALSSHQESWYAMAHFQSIPGSGDSSKVVPGEPVPEPTAIAALGLGLAALVRRRKR